MFSFLNKATTRFIFAKNLNSPTTVYSKKNTNVQSVKKDIMCSVLQLLASQSVEQAEAVARRLQREVDSKREELRIMVGERYRYSRGRWTPRVRSFVSWLGRDTGTAEGGGLQEGGAPHYGRGEIQVQQTVLTDRTTDVHSKLNCFLLAVLWSRSRNF